MERLMMKNSAGFKVDLLWYATSSRMQLPMSDRIPVKQKEIELCYTLCTSGDLSPQWLIHTVEISVLCGLTKYAVEWTHEDVMLLGDGGGKHSRCVGSISHLKCCWHTRVNCEIMLWLKDSPKLNTTLVIKTLKREQMCCWKSVQLQQQEAISSQYFTPINISSG